MTEETKKAVKVEKKAKVAKERQYRVQSGKFWHEGDSFYIIYSEGLDGTKSAKKRIGPFSGLEEMHKKMGELIKEAKMPTETPES